jgi:hypothetical protein
MTVCGPPDQGRSLQIHHRELAAGQFRQPSHLLDRDASLESPGGTSTVFHRIDVVIRLHRTRCLSAHLADLHRTHSRIATLPEKDGWNTSNCTCPNTWDLIATRSLGPDAASKVAACTSSTATSPHSGDTLILRAEARIPESGPETRTVQRSSFKERLLDPAGQVSCDGRRPFRQPRHHELDLLTANILRQDTHPV